MTTSTTLYLTRTAEIEAGTFGRLNGLGQDLHTVERTAVMIPVGRYRLSRRMFNRGGYWAAEVEGVRGRKYILIHVANWPEDLDGCIGVGLARGQLKRAGAPGPTEAVLSSGVAFDILMDALERQWEDGVETWIEVSSAVCCPGETTPEGWV